MKVAHISSGGLNDRVNGHGHGGNGNVDLMSLLITSKANINEQISERRAATARPVPLSTAEKCFSIDAILKSFNENRARSKLASEMALLNRRPKTAAKTLSPNQTSTQQQQQQHTVNTPTLSATLRASSKKSTKTLKSTATSSNNRPATTAGNLRRPSVVLSTSDSGANRSVKRDTSRKSSVDHSVASYYTHPESASFANELNSNQYEYEEEDDNVFEESQTLESGQNRHDRHAKGVKSLYSSPSLATINELHTNSSSMNNKSSSPSTMTTTVNPVISRKFSSTSNNVAKFENNSNSFSNTRTSIELIQLPPHLQQRRPSTTSNFLSAPVRTHSISQSGAGIAANQRASIVPGLAKRRPSKSGFGLNVSNDDFFSSQHQGAQQQRPKLPRIVANMSKEFRYAMLKSYEDLMHDELARTFPDLAHQLPRTPALSLPVTTTSISRHAINRDFSSSPVSSRQSNNSNLSNYTALGNKLISTDIDGVKSQGNYEPESEDLEDHNKRVRASALIDSAMKILDEIKAYQQSGKQRRSPSTSVTVAPVHGNQASRKASISIDHDTSHNYMSSYKSAGIQRLRQGSVTQQIIEEDPLNMYKRWVDACSKEFTGSDF